MDKINSYNIYQTYQSKFTDTKAKKAADNSTTAPKSFADTFEKSTDYGVKVNKTESPKETRELSDAAKKLLSELKEKYNNTDIMVADFETDQEADEIMSKSKGTNAYTMLIDPDELEKMASDEEYKTKIMGIIDDATSALDDMKEELTDEENASIKKIGFSIGTDGSVNFYAQLEKSSEAQAKRIEEIRARKKAEAKEAEKNAEEKAEEKRAQAKEARYDEAVEKLEKGQKPNFTSEIQRTYVTANSASELLDAIRGVDWSSVPTTQMAGRGGNVDFSV